MPAYRKFFEYFPVGQTVSPALVDEVLSMLVYKNVGAIDQFLPLRLLLTWRTDQLTSMASTVGIKPDEIQKLASMIKTARSQCRALCSLLSATH